MTPNIVPCFLTWCRAYWEQRLEAAVQAEREQIAKEVRVFQDIVGWQKYESRNQLVQDIENMIRARTAQDEGGGKRNE